MVGAVVTGRPVESAWLLHLNRQEVTGVRDGPRTTRSIFRQFTGTEQTGVEDLSASNK